MANKLYEETNIQSIANAIRNKNGSQTTYTVSEMANAITNIPTKTVETWHQCPTAVKNYLDNVTYNSNDYTTTQITSYAPSTVVTSNTKPIGKIIDGVTYYNEVPNIATPFSSTNTSGTLMPLDRLRWINSITTNCRDLGGWACDGGTVKYGKIYRCGAIDVADTDLFVNKLGIGCEIDLRDTETHSPVLGDNVKYVDVNGTSITYTINGGLDSWKTIIKTIFDCATYGQPVIFHCSAGRDRTGTIACIIEAILGVSQSDIDKDYELTCFALYVGTNVDPLRTKISWSGTGGLIPMIVAKPGNTFRDKVINWVTTLGFTAKEINNFRKAMIDGTPSTITPDVGTATITNNLTNMSSNNSLSSITKYQPYYAEITPDDTTTFNSYSIIIGGVDMTSNYAYIKTESDNFGSDYKIIIDIPSGVINGNIVINAQADLPTEPYTLLQYAYVETSKTGVVDTEYQNTVHTGFSVTFKGTGTSSLGMNSGICGNNDFAFGVLSDYRAFKSTNKSFKLGDFDANTQHTVTLNYNDDGKVYIDGTNKSWNSSTQTYNLNETFKIFSAGSHSSFTSNAYQKQISEFIITEAGVAVKTFKPCRRNSDNNIGFMEINSETFYPSVGDVKAGADATE